MFLIFLFFFFFFVCVSGSNEQGCSVLDLSIWLFVCLCNFGSMPVKVFIFGICIPCVKHIKDDILMTLILWPHLTFSWVMCFTDNVSFPSSKKICKGRQFWLKSLTQISVNLHYSNCGILTLVLRKSAITFGYDC